MNKAFMFSAFMDLPFWWGQLNKLRKANKIINNYNKMYEEKKQGVRENDAVSEVEATSDRVVRVGAEEVLGGSCDNRAR